MIRTKTIKPASFLGGKIAELYTLTILKTCTRC